MADIIDLNIERGRREFPTAASIIDNEIQYLTTLRGLVTRPGITPEALATQAGHYKRDMTSMIDWIRREQDPDRLCGITLGAARNAIAWLAYAAAIETANPPGAA